MLLEDWTVVLDEFSACLTAKSGKSARWYNLVMSAKDRDSQFPGQLEGETVDFVFHQHPLVMRKELIVGLLLVNLGVLPLVFPQVYDIEGLADFLIKVALGVPALVLVWWFHRWVGWYYTVYIVTDRRVVAVRQKGFFDRTVQEWQLNNIYNVNYRIGGLQAALFGFGDITAKTAIGEFTMPTIHKPTEIHRRLLEAVQAAGGGRQAVSQFDN